MSLAGCADHTTHERRPANAAVEKAQLAELLGVVYVAAVEQYRQTHQTANAGEIGLAKLLPFRHQNQGVGALCDMVGRLAQA
ncbi:hypothetical protein D3C87_2120000 [compost metagenome]